jgi:hypothetical protein
MWHAVFSIVNFAVISSKIVYAVDFFLSGLLFVSRSDCGSIHFCSIELFLLLIFFNSILWLLLTVTCQS